MVQSQRAGESGLNYFLNWIDDGAGLFSMETTDTLARNNLDLNNTYGCLLALKTVNYLNGQDIASYSKDLFQQVDLGRKDMLLVIESSSQAWYLVYGGGLRTYAENNDALAALLEKAQAMAEQAGGAQTEAERLRAQEAMAVAAAADQRAELAAAEAERAQIRERQETAERDRAAAEEQLQSARQEAKENRRALEDARDEAEAAANIIAGHSLRMEERRKKAAAAGEKKVQLTMDVGALDNRIRLLTEMEKEYEGFSKAVKLVCQAQNSLRGIHGPVAGLMRTDGRYSLAIEIALGAGLQNIVVDREEDAKAAIGYLKQRDAGRATFLPLTAIRGEELRERGVESEFGFVGLASRLVTFDPKYQNIFHLSLIHI